MAVYRVFPRALHPQEALATSSAAANEPPAHTASLTAAEEQPELVEEVIKNNPEGPLKDGPKPKLVIPAAYAGAGRAERQRAATFAGLNVQVGALCCGACACDAHECTKG